MGRGIRRHPVWMACIGVALVLASAWIVVMLSVVKSAGQVREGARTIAALAGDEQIGSILQPEDYSKLRSSIGDLHREVKSLQSRLFLAKPVALVPGVSGSIGNAEEVLAFADATLQAVSSAMDAYLPAVQAMDIGRVDYEALREQVVRERPLFDQAFDALQRAKAFRRGLDPAKLGEQERKAVEMLDTLLPALELAIIAGKETPEAVAAGVHIRSVIRETQTMLRDPSELLFNARRSRDTFATLEGRAGQVLGGLSNLKGRAETSDAALQEALDLGIEVAALLQSLSNAMATFTQATDDYLQAGMLSEEGAAAMKSNLPTVKAALADAQLALDQVLARRTESTEAASSLTGRFFTSVLLNIEESSLQTTLLPRAAQGVDSLQYLLGFDGPRTYLLIGQNPDEIRPTGGFLGVVVEVHVQDGRLTSLRYFDSDTVDPPDFSTNPIAPEPIFRYLWISRMLFRDANWNPHFPSSAAQIADLYYKGQGVQADGVIAATEDMVLHLVDAMGGVEVPEIVGVLDGATAGKYVDGLFSYPCLPRHTVLRSKRCFDEDLFQAVLGKMMQPLAEEQSKAILDAFLQGLAHKDVLVHVFDPKAADILWEQQWNGALRQVDHDYIMVVDSSLPGHARSIINRRIQYQVQLSAGSDIQASLLLSYKHTGQQPDPDCRQAITNPLGCFWDYVRIYVPVQAADIQAPPIPAAEGSELLVWGYDPADTLTVISSPRSGTERLTEIAGYVVVEPGTNVTVPISYSLPPGLVRQIGQNTYEYRLLVQRQPGAPDEPVDVFLKLPPDGAMVSSSPAPVSADGEWLRFTVTLDGDHLITLQYRGG